ncbi:MAG TPA: hypothetical protein VHF24_11665 [Acidimicrobiales bacterium]|nr:hypothetical protein [Acidimicrobiales bacterium]
MPADSHGVSDSLLREPPSAPKEFPHRRGGKLRAVPSLTQQLRKSIHGTEIVTPHVHVLGIGTVQGNSRHPGPFYARYRTPAGDEIVSPPCESPEQAEDWWLEMHRRQRTPLWRERLIRKMSAALGDGGVVEASFETNAIDQRFYCAGRLRLFEGRLIVTELKLSSASAQMDAFLGAFSVVEGITGSVLRQVPLGQLLAEARERLVYTAHSEDEVPPEVRRAVRDLVGPVDQMISTGKRPAGHRRPGPKGKSDDFYRTIAVDYIEYVEANGGDARKVLKALEQKHHGSTSAVRDWVRKARDKGFLAPTTRGRANAAPGPRLYATNEEQP